MRWTTVDSPIGELLLTGDDDGALCGLWMRTPGGPPPGPTWGPPAPRRGERPSRPPADAVRDDGAFASVARQLREYFAGERTAFDVALRMDGTAFQRRVWAALREIPYGETRSYGELSDALGLGARGARAVGLANGRNPISVIVPCHRVIGADGSLTGFGGGIERKRLLLALESPALTLAL